MPAIKNYQINQINQSHQRLNAQIATAQERIATGDKYSVSSDNPLDWALISDIARKKSDLDAWRSNIDISFQISAQGADTLGSVHDMMVRAKELLISGVSDTVGGDGRELIARELEGLASSINNALQITDLNRDPLFPEKAASAIPIGDENEIVAKISLEQLGDFVDTVQRTATFIRDPSTGQHEEIFNQVEGDLQNLRLNMASLGQIGSNLETVRDQIISTELSLDEQNSSLSDADLAEEITNLQRMLVQLQAAQGAFARISSESLFDYLR